MLRNSLEHLRPRGDGKKIDEIVGQITKKKAMSTQLQRASLCGTRYMLFMQRPVLIRVVTVTPVQPRLVLA